MSNAVLSNENGKQAINLLQRLDVFTGVATGKFNTAYKREKDITINFMRKMRQIWYNDSVMEQD